MEWTDDECSRLINLYKSRPILWDPEHPHYKMGKKKIDFWLEIAIELKRDLNDTKKKMESLLGSFRRERQRESSSGRSGAGTDQVYHSKWFAFEEMKFLIDKFKPRDTKNTLDSVSTQVTEDLDVEGIEEVDVEQPQKEKVFISPKKTTGIKRKKVEEDPRITETYKLIKDISEKRQIPKVRNDSTIFGEYVASKLELFDRRTRTILQHQISSLLCNAEINYTFNNPANSANQVFQQTQPSVNPMSFLSPVSSPATISVHSMSPIPPPSPVSYTSTMHLPSYQDISNIPSPYIYQNPTTKNQSTSNDEASTSTFINDFI